MKNKYALTIADIQLDVLSEAPQKEVDKISGIVDRKMREIYLNSRSRWPLQVVLRNLLENAVTSEIDYGDSATLPVEPLKMAVVVFTTAPIVILYPFIQKYFVKGALVGSIKG